MIIMIVTVIVSFLESASLSWVQLGILAAQGGGALGGFSPRVQFTHGVFYVRNGPA